MFCIFPTDLNIFLRFIIIRSYNHKKFSTNLVSHLQTQLFGRPLPTIISWHFRFEVSAQKFCYYKYFNIRLVIFVMLKGNGKNAIIIHVL